MSDRTWREEFYPIVARSTIKEGDKTIINHAIRKWTGLLPENLAKHEVYFTNGDLSDEQGLFLAIDGSSCGLCLKYVDDNTPYPSCPNCPLNKLLGHACDDDKYGEESVYARGLENPQIMIDVLKLLEESL